MTRWGSIGAARTFLCLGFVLAALTAMTGFGAHSALPPRPSQQTTATAAPLRLGIAGLVHGHVSGFLQHLQQRTDVELVGIAEPDGPVREKYRARFGLRADLFDRDLSAMLARARPEAVMAFTTTQDHLPVVEACARAGVHVMMEKPLATSLAAARAMAAAAARHGIHVMVNYETTWYPSNHAVRDAVAAGRLGRVRKLVAHDGHRGPKEIGVQPEFLAWLTDPVANGGGALTDFGCYGANLFTWLMGNTRPVAVRAATQTFKPAIYPRVDDEANIVVLWPEAVGIIQASWNWPFDRKDLEVYGSTGQALTVRREAVRWRLEGQKEEEEVRSPALMAPEGDPVSYLAAVVRGGIRPLGLSSLDNNLIVTEILDAARESARTGAEVRLEPRGPRAHGAKQGSPEENLPPNISRLTYFGERASWSPDGKRVAFMEKSFGDAFEVDISTRTIRLLTHYPHPGFLRVQYLPNGDYFLIGARTFTDIRSTRSRDQEMWILKADARPGDRAVPLEHKISEGVAISRTSPKIAWSNTRGQYPDLLQEGESVIYTADIVYHGGQPKLVNKKEVIRAKTPECTLEAQDFRKNDTELIYTCYRSPYADVLGVDLNSRKVAVYRKVADEYNEVEGIFPSGEYTLVESSRDQVEDNSNFIDIWKLKLEPNSTDYVRMTRWGEYEGYKASNPVVSPNGKTIAFQSARSKDPAGVGYGIFLLTLEGSSTKR
jgi:predicted dehydrogenase